MAISNIQDAIAAQLGWSSMMRASDAAQSVRSSASTSISAQPKDFSTFSQSAADEDSALPSLRLSATFTPNIGGQNMACSVAEEAGEYVASAPNPPGAIAHGTTLESAEYNLKLKLDAIV